ncbi:MAG: hypothetical protein ACLPTZ_25370 [Beijerinckiaceae bacterium]
MSKLPSIKDHLSKISEAIDESILDASEADLREEFAELGDDFEKVVMRVGAVIDRAKASAAKLRFEQAKLELRTFREKGSTHQVDLANARRQLDRLRAGNSDDLDGVMMAARKGGKLSNRDEAGILDDLTQLDALENEACEEGDK